MKTILTLFAIVLAFACLAKDASQDELLLDGQRLLGQVPTLASATARRVALELLWLVTEMRPGVLQCLGKDTSPTVQALQSFLSTKMARAKTVQLLKALCSTSPHRFNWGGLDLLIACEPLPADLVSALPTGFRS